MVTIQTPCSLSNSPLPALCLNDGMCYQSVTESCLCPSGFVSDNTIFHRENCGLPELVPFYFIIYFSFASFFSFVILFRQWLYTHRLAARLGGCSLGLIFVCWLIALAEYLQQGYYEAVTVFVFFAEIIFVYLILYLFLAFIIPLCTIFRLSSTRIRFVLRLGSKIILFCVCCIFFALVSSTRNVHLFNQIQLAHIVIFLTLNAVFTTLLIGQSWNLVKLLKQLHQNPDMPTRRLKEIKTLEMRTQFMTLSLVIYLILGCGSVVVILVQQAYTFVFALLLVHFAIILGMGMRMFLKRGMSSEAERSTVGYAYVKEDANNGNKNDADWTDMHDQQPPQHRILKNNASGHHKGRRSVEDFNTLVDTLATFDKDDDTFQVNRRRVGDVVVSSSAAPQLSRVEISEVDVVSIPLVRASNNRSDLSVGRLPMSVEEYATLSPPNFLPPPIPHHVMEKTMRTSGRYRSSITSHRRELVSSVYETDFDTPLAAAADGASRPPSRPASLINRPWSKRTGPLGYSKFKSGSPEIPSNKKTPTPNF